MVCNSEMFPPEQQQSHARRIPKSCRCVAVKSIPSLEYIAKCISAHIKKKLYDVYTWILVARNSAEIIKVQPKQQTRQYSVLSGVSWKTAPGCPHLSSYSLCSAPCTYSGQLVKTLILLLFFFPSSPSFSVLLSPSLPRCEKPFQSVLLSL